MVKQKYFTLFFVVWFCVILFLSVIPDNSPDSIKINIYEFRLDYLKHFLVYLPLGFTLLSIKGKSSVFLTLVGLFVASVPECIQYFLPHRTFNPIDLFSNALGFVFGLWLFSFLNKKTKIFN